MVGIARDTGNAFPMKDVTSMKRLVAAAAATALLTIAPGCAVETTKTNRVGDHIKPIVNAVPGPGEKLSKYCTAYNPDPELHKFTIKELVAAGKPFVLIFGTPSHCTQCQNQIDTVRHYQEQYQHAFEVIHIDQYKNSHVYTEMGVAGDPWTFLVDGRGVIQAVYPGVTTWDNLDADFARMLGKAV